MRTVGANPCSLAVAREPALDVDGALEPVGGPLEGDEEAVAGAT